MANFAINGFHQIYAQIAAKAAADAAQASAPEAAVAANPEAAPAAQPIDRNTVTGSCSEAAFQPQATSFPTPAKPALAGVPAMVRAIKAKADSAPPTIEAINERYAKKLQTLKENEAMDPAFRQKVVRQIHDEHIGDLAMAVTDAPGHQGLSEELSSYQSTVQSVRSGAMLASHPDPGYDAGTQARIEDTLYEDLVREMSGLD